MAGRESSARDDRTRDDRSRGAATASRTVTSGARRTGSARAGDRRPGTRPAADRRPGSAATSAAPVPGDGLVVGDLPGAARAVGVLLVLAGLAGAAALFPTYLVVGGRELTLGGGLGGVLVGLVVPLTAVAVGAGLAAGRVPRLGLAYAGVGGALALGSLLIEVYRGSTSTVRPGIEVLAGERVLTSSVQTGAGWWLQVAALALTVVAGVLAAATWNRTVMEDRGALDPARPGLAGAAVVLGVLTVLCLALPAADVPDRLVDDPSTGLEVVVEQQGPQALLERPGLALLGGLLLAGAVLLGSVLAPSLRPRLAAVGGFLAVAVTVLAAGLGGLRDAVASDELDWTVPGAGLLAAGLAYGVLTLLAWRLRRSRS
ncbi:hypothetical protein GCM10027451_23120 [Geodermatophilus aquaeductus]|uniref:Uncharacterized protein n=1 Tax=Geodermatophilus aquaeductus TaxID=1564161 RepID=A0A521AH95_9ACTN|nr:hypothetical protein [Geodermatophilus aquaeductus]SMO34205.1 hypothetical protein SAMN06273567_101119 [Geodermatophilus aquaeductus]